MGSISDLKKRIRVKETDDNKRNGSLSKLKERIDRSHTFGVDDDYIQSFLKDSENFIKGAEASYSGINYNNASYRYSNIDSMSRGLRERAGNIRAFINSNKDYIDDESYKSLSSYLDDFSKGNEQIWKTFYNAKSNFGKYETEYDYNAAVMNSGDSSVEDRRNAYAANKERVAELDNMLKGKFGFFSRFMTDDQIKKAYGENAPELFKEKERLSLSNNQYERGLKVNDDYYDFTLASDWKEDSAYREYNNPTKDDYIKYYAIVNNPNTSDSDYQEAVKNKPEIVDRLGLFLSATEQEHNAAVGGQVPEYDDVLIQGSVGSWNQLKNEEIEMYYYLLRNNGKETADKYLDDMKTELNRRETQGYTDYIFNEASGLEKLALNIASVPMSVLGGLPAIVDDAVNIVKGKDINPYSFGHVMQNVSQDTRSATAEDLNELTNNTELLGITLGDAYQSVMSTADSAVGVAVGSGVYGVLMGMGAASSEARELYEKGASKGQIAWGGILAGAAEMIFEKASIEHLFKLGDPKSVGKVVKNLLSQGGFEASEEVFTEVANTITDAIVMGSQSEWSQSIQKYLDNGLTESEATGRALMDVGKNVWKAGIGGFISGGLLGGVCGTSSYLNYKNAATKHGQSIIDTGGYDDLMALAKDVTGANQNANVPKSDIKHINKLLENASKDASPQNVGFLSDQLNDFRSTQNKADIQSALMEKGLNKRQAGKVASYLNNAVEGGEYTNAQVEQMMNNDAIMQVAREISDNKDSSVNKRNKQHNLGRVGVKVSEDGYLSLRNAQNKAKSVGDGNSKTRVKNVIDSELSVSDDGVTKIAETGNAVKINGIADIKTEKGENGKVYAFPIYNVVDSDGNESVVSSRDVEYGNRAEGILYESFANMGLDPSYFNTYYEDLKRDGIDITDANAVSQFALDYELGVNFGVAGLESEIDRVNLSEVSRAHAYASGMGQAKADLESEQSAIDKAVEERKASGKGKVKTKGEVHFDSKKINTNMRRSGVELGKRLASLGLDVYFYESHQDAKGNFVDDKGNPADNGYYLPGDGSIHIDLNAGNNGQGIMVYTMAHELVHFMRRNNPREFKIFADKIVQWYGKKGQSVSDLITERMDEEDLSWNEAYEEVIARSCEAFFTDSNAAERLAELEQTDKKTANIIRNWIRRFMNWVRSLYKDIDPESAEGQLFHKWKNEVEEIHDAFFQTLQGAVESHQWIGAIDFSAVSAAKTTDGKALFQHRAMEADKATYRNMLIKHGVMTSSEITTLFNTVDKALEIIKSNLETLDYAWDADINDRAFSPVKPNSDSLYQVSLDFSTLCRKRILQQVVQAQLQEALDKQLSREESIAIRDELMKIQEEGRQIEIACALCYVESARMKSPAQIKKFMENREAVIREFLASKSGGDIKQKIKRAELDMRNKLGVGNESLKKMPKSVADQIRAAKKQAKKSYEPTTDELKLIDVALGMSVSDFTSPQGLENLAKNYPVLFDAYTSYVRNATKSKGIENDTWWRAGDSASIGDTLIANMNRENGLRSQSWSDFQVIHLLDYIAATIELSTRNAKEQAYSKVPDYIELMGKTGVMLNMSLIPTSDFSGTLEYDSTEGIDYTRSLELREKYHATAGTICIGMDNGQIKLLLADGTIDYVIPYHKSGMAAHIRKLMHIPDWVDYEPYQSEANLSRSDAEKNAKKYGVKLLDESDPNYHKHTSFSEWFNLEEAKQIAKMENAHPSNTEAQKKYGVMYGGYMAMQNAANNYLKLCAERGIAPKFSHENADFTGEDNYWKLLIDRKMVDNVTGEIIEQKTIQPIFDEAEVLRILNDELERYPKVKADQEYATRKVVEKFLSGKMNDRLDADTIAAIMKKPVDNVTATNIMSNGEEVMREEDAIEFSDVEVKHSLRKTAPPKKTIKAYKVFVVKDGQLYPPMVANPSGAGTPVGVWLNADTGNLARDKEGNLITTKETGRLRVQQGGKGTNKSASGSLAWRPGWHLGEWPDAKQFAVKNPTTGKLELLPENFVFAECEIAADVDYQLEALEYGVSEKGTFNRTQAGLPYIPRDGFYKYRTNPNPETSPWYISGAMKVTKILDDAMCREICAKYGVTPMPRRGGDIDLTKFGLKAGEVTPTEDLSSVPEAVDLSDEVKALPGYVRRPLNFSDKTIRKEFDINKIDVDYYENLYNETHAKEFDGGVKRSSRQKAPTFYSYMGVVVDGVKQEKLGAASVINMLKGKGVKDDEIKWSGIETWLEGKKSVTKKELQEFIAGSQLLIEEKTLRLNNNAYMELDGLWNEYFNKPLEDSFDVEKVDQFDGMEIKAELAYLEEGGYDMPPQDVQDHMAELADAIGSPTKWHDYKLDGGENYREVLFSMPNSSYSNRAMDAHWGTEGVLAHARVQDFNSDGKKMLFIEEIQSDWHNAGHKGGYRVEGVEDKRSISYKMHKASEEFFSSPIANLVSKRIATVGYEGAGVSMVLNYLLDGMESMNTTLNMLERKGVSFTENEVNEIAEYTREYERLYHKWQTAPGELSAPEAPFKDTYHEYVLKRLIRMAAEEGYDSIGWTTADTQSKRWSDQYAEGYRIEYDQDIPKFLRKYVNKWGSSVSKTEVNGETVWSMPITEPMKNSVLYDGQPMYSRRGVSNRSLLANALESATKNDIEKNRLNEYKGKIALIESEQKKLTDLRARIKELSFAPGTRDTVAIKNLQDSATRVANRINNYDRQLLNLEATAPLKAVLEREKELAKKKAQQEGREALSAYREKAAKTLKETITRNQEARKRGIESRNKTEMRHKIKSVVSELNKLLLHGTKDRHIMIDLQKATADALSAVNMDTVNAEKRLAEIQRKIDTSSDPDEIERLQQTYDRIELQGENMSQRLTALKDAYEEIKDSSDPLVANAYHPEIEDRIKNLRKEVGDTPLREMSLEQLELVYDTYKMVLTTIRNANKLFKDKKSEDIATIGNRVMDEVREVGGSKTYIIKKSDWLNKQYWNNMKPVYAFKAIGSDTLSEMFDNVRAGEDTWAVDVSEAKVFFRDTANRYGYDSWDFDKQYKFTSKTGKEFSLSIEQIMSLYAYSKRKQADEHLEKGGFVFDGDIEVTKKTKLGVPITYKVNTATAHNISKDQLGYIIATLSESQKAFVDEMQSYLSDTMGAKGNEVSLELYGVKLFKEKTYFPLKSAKQFMFEKNEVAGEVRLRNSGFSKETVEHASNPIILSNFMDVWASHVNDMSMYHAFVLPLEDFNRVFNYKTPTTGNIDTESVKMYIQNAYGSNPVEYIKQLLTDINGGARTDPTADVITKMTGKFKKAAVFASASVVVQQPSALARAFALVDPKYFATKPFSATQHKAEWEEVKKYAPVAIIKEMGYFDTNMGRSTTDFIKAKEYNGLKEKAKGVVVDSDYRDEVISKLPALADEVTWCYIWNAVKKEVADTTELDVGSEVFLEKCGKRFTEVIVNTQVYDSVLSRSAMMRSKDTGMKMLTSFMAEPTTSINMLVDAVIQGKRGNGKAARKIVGAVVASLLLNSVLSAIVYAGRDDDEDKTYAEKYAKALISEILDSLNPLTMIPFVKDIISICQGYDVERSDMAVISDLYNAFNKLSSDNYSAWRKIEDFGGAIASLFGLPLKNIMREMRGIYNTVTTFTSGQKTTGRGMGQSILEALPGKDKDKGEQLYDAIISGDKAHEERLRKGYKTTLAAEIAIRTALRENDPRIKKAAEARNRGNISEYSRIARQIIAEGNFSQDTVVSAINSEINAMNNVESSAKEDTTVEPIFRAKDINAALENGDTATAKTVISEIISEKVADGKTEKEAKASVKSSVTSYWKPMYLDAYNSGNSTEMTRIRRLLEATGLYVDNYKKSTVVETCQNWVKNQ